MESFKVFETPKQGLMAMMMRSVSTVNTVGRRDVLEVDDATVEAINREFDFQCHENDLERTHPVNNIFQRNWDGRSYMVVTKALVKRVDVAIKEVLEVELQERLEAVSRFLLAGA